MMEVSSEREQKVNVPKNDLSKINLQTIFASEQELTEHASVLAQIDKSSNGNTVWKSAQQSQI